jgi:hypothetical protein
VKQAQGNEWLAFGCWLYCVVVLVLFAAMARMAPPPAEIDLTLCPLCDRPVQPSSYWGLHPAS